MENLNQAAEGGPSGNGGSGFLTAAERIVSDHDFSAGNGGVIFDAGSGISEAEQREILAGINRITEKNRQALSGGRPTLRARKRGGIFPALVNVAAILVLGGGFFLLSTLHDKEDIQFRESPAAYNPAERALIDEIRRETASQLEAKEGEISLITSKLTGVDSELQNLQSSVETMMGDKETELRKEMEDAFAVERQRLVDQNLSEAAIAERMRLFDADRITRMNTELTSYRQRLDAERAASESNLQRLQDEYRAGLSTLQEERSQILESSRTREASLHAQLEARTRELNAVSEQSQSALSSARSELERLSADQEKAAVIEGQLGGYYGTVLNHIRGGRLNEAAAAVQALRDFLSSPAVTGSPAVQSRREIYTAAADALDMMIRGSLAVAGGFPLPAADDPEAEKAITDLQDRNALLEENIAELNRTIAAYSSQGSSLGQRIAETEETASALRTLNQSLQQQVNDREQTIAGLQSQSAAQSEIISARETRINELQSANTAQAETITNLNTQLESIRQALQALSQ